MWGEFGDIWKFGRISYKITEKIVNFWINLKDKYLPVIVEQEMWKFPWQQYSVLSKLNNF